MNKLFAILYSLLILLQSFNINFEDISKFNVLLEHADYHQETYGDSFLEFLAEHYGDAKIDHGVDHDEHENLPYKHHHQSCAHVSFAFTFETIDYQFNYVPFLEIPFNFFYKETISSFEKPVVFQPPKLA